VLGDALRFIVLDWTGKIDSEGVEALLQFSRGD
jgi:hypothetical protein